MKRVTVASTLTSLFVVCLIIVLLSGDNCDSCFSVPAMMGKFFACGLVIFIGSIFYTRLYLRNEKQIFSIETAPLLETNEASADVPFSCEGEVVPDGDKILKSPYLGLPCVYYHSITEKRVGSGDHQRWQVVENMVNLSPFYIADERGKLKVDPANLDSDFSGFPIGVKKGTVPKPDTGEIDCTAVMKHQVLTSGAVFLGVNVGSEKYRRSEYILPTQTRVFAYGYISKRGDELILHEYPNYPLIISQKSKEAYISEFYKGSNLIYVVHFLVAIGFSISLLSADYFLRLGPTVTVPLLIAGNELFVLSLMFTMYNRLITLAQRAKFALTDIDIELKRRTDLIPKIVELVRAYSTYEKELTELISRMREQAVLVNALPEGPKIDVSPLLAIAEKYPDLKASDNFKKLMLSLVDTEERIAYARAFYNRSVRKLNTLANQFPFILIAYLTDIKQMPFVTVTSSETSPPSSG